MDRADQLLQETVTLANEIGQYWALATALAYLALVAVEVRTDYRRAGGLIKQGSSSRSTSPTAGSPYITWTLRAGSRFRRVARQERRRPCWEPAARCRSAWAPAFIQRSPGAMNAPWPRCATSCRPKHSALPGMTTETHVDHVRGKLGVRSRAQIAAWAIEHGLVATKRG